MDERRELRFQTDQAVGLTLLAEPERCLPARVVNACGRGLCLEVCERIAAGAAVRVDIDRTLLLAEVVYCRPEGSRFHLGLEIEHSLTNAEELARLMRSILGEAPSSERDQRVRTP